MNVCTAQPTTTHLLNFLLSSDAEILLNDHRLSMQVDAEGANNVQATCTCSDRASIFACHRCWLGSATLASSPLPVPVQSWIKKISWNNPDSSKIESNANLHLFTPFTPLPPPFACHFVKRQEKWREEEEGEEERNILLARQAERKEGEEKRKRNKKKLGELQIVHGTRCKNAVVLLVAWPDHFEKKRTWPFFLS